MRKHVLITALFISSIAAAQVSVDSLAQKKVDTEKVTSKINEAKNNVKKEAQDSVQNSTDKSSFWDKVKFGSGFGLNFLGGTNISISPNAIYNFDNGLALGVGLTYAYSKVETTKNNTFGGSLLSFYTIPKTAIQLSGEYELLRSKLTDDMGEVSNTTSALFLGATYNLGKIAIGFRYNLLFNDESPYSQAFLPVVRVGF